ncbi:MAG TPA: SulP family inorganic anion transporter [Longimicrobiales bacterium]|nr:SulP family inorganic anion transporter [Longimicrobiales bacterium]
MAGARLPHRGKEGPGPRLTSGDVVAGVTMALVLIPQSLAYAQVAGLPAHVGLYAAALPPLAAAFFASSPYLQTGPAAVTAILTAGALAPLAAAGSAEYVRLAALLALVVGVIRVGIGLLRAGKVVFLMSEPVLRGFTTGAAILILASQVSGAVGLAPEGSGLSAAFRAFGEWREWQGQALAAAAATILVVVSVRRLHPLAPGVLIASVGAVVVSALAGYDAPVLGAIPEGLPPLSLALPFSAVPSLALAGAVIALAGFSEAASIARTYATRERQRWDPDREFISQGVANLAAGISGGFPVGGSFSRSSIAHMAGAKTRWSGAVTGAAVLAFLPFANVLAPLPIAVLSALVMTAVVGLIRPGQVLVLWRLSRPQFLVAATTLVLTLALAPHIEQAVVLGILLAGAIHLWREFHVLVDRWTDEGALHLRPHGVLWFGSAEALKSEVLDLLAEHQDASAVVFHVERLGRVDLTGALVLEQLVTDLRSAGVAVRVEGVHRRTARALRRVLAVSRQGRTAEPAEPPAPTPVGRPEEGP